MKKLFYLMTVCLCVIMGAVTLNSCSQESLLGLFMGKSEPTTLEEDTKENTLTLSFDGGDCLSKWIATFDDKDLCVKFLQIDTYKKKADADEEWEWGGYENNPKYSKDGKTITYDATDEYRGKTKAEIRKKFQEIVDEDNEED